MKRRILVSFQEYNAEEHKDALLLALEAGVHGLIVPDFALDSVKPLARCEFYRTSSVYYTSFSSKEDEISFADSIRKAETNTLYVLEKGWEIIPVENLLAQKDILHGFGLEVESLEEARLACGILERGVETLIVSPKGLKDIRAIMALASGTEERMILECATITAIRNVGLGHRVCVDTMSLLEEGQGMLVGNSSAFTFLAHAETAHNNYVNSRPFRINAGAVHAYAMMPEDKTAYLQEIQSGDEVLIVNTKGQCELAVVGRVKVEVRPMLYVEAVAKNGQKGSVFLQNAETIRVVNAQGQSISVVDLQLGDEVLCHLDTAGRHFGMRVDENINE